MFLQKKRSPKKTERQESSELGSDYDSIAFLQEGSHQFESAQRRLQSASTAPGSNFVLVFYFDLFVSLLLCFLFIILPLPHYVAYSLYLKRLKCTFVVFSLIYFTQIFRQQSSPATLGFLDTIYLTVNSTSSGTLQVTILSCSGCVTLTSVLILIAIYRCWAHPL